MSRSSSEFQNTEAASAAGERMGRCVKHTLCTLRDAKTSQPAALKLRATIHHLLQLDDRDHPQAGGRTSRLPCMRCRDVA